MTAILIVDDVAANREFLATLLAYKDYQVLQASDGAEALALARSARPDLIITDILMPTMDGYEFVRQLRIDPQIANTVVIFCTADYREHEAHNLARACGVAHLLIKPCEPELVLRTVESALGLATQSPMPVPSPEFDRDHLRLVTDKLSGKAAELEAVNQRLAALIDISLQLASEPDRGRLLESVCHSARALIGARYAAIAAGPDTETAEVARHFFASGMDPAAALGMPSLKSGLLGKVLTERRACRLADTEQIVRSTGLPPHFPRMRCLLAVPISSLEHTYGWLCLGDKAGALEFAIEDEQLLAILGSQVGRMYENLALYAEAQSHAIALQQEATERKLAQTRLKEQLARLDLLRRITRAIGERQDLRSIFQVVVRSLENDLPIDFGCICLYDPVGRVLTVTSVGARGSALAPKLAMTENASIAVDDDGLARCVDGAVVYEPNTERAPLSFPQRLALAGLHAVVAAPLLAESRVFGVLIAARRPAQSFSSSDCEFLRQLSEHVALATHQAQLYGALQRAYQDLRESQQAVMQQERLRALGEMASGVAHDINNSIFPVSLYVDLLLEQQGDLNERSRSYLRTIKRAIQDVAQTVSRMREFCRSREPRVMDARADLNRVIAQVVEFTRVRWRDVPQEHGAVIELQQELAANLPDIFVTESELRDALTNLIFNAVDAMPGGGKLALRTHAGASQTAAPTIKTVLLEVSDTGVGMDKETRRRCLEPFFTTKGERGTGMGLAMVYGMAQRHGVEIEIESTLGRGTTIRLTFPVASAAANDVPPQASIAPMRSLSILIVDDDPLILESMQATLQADGHIVTAADGGQAGIDSFMSAQRGIDPFAVVITDLGMPYIDGRKVAAAVKASSPTTPVILLTGWGRRMAADNEVPPHVDRLLGKPPSLAELRRTLAEVTASAGSP